MGSMIFLIVLMIFTVIYLMLGGISLLKNDDNEQDEIYTNVQRSLLK